MKEKKKKSTFWKDFKAFISRGNIIDLAVAVVVGAAFTAIVNSLVNDVIKPLIALLADGNFSELLIVLRAEEISGSGEVIKEAITLNYGNLLMAILTFLIDAFVIFIVLRIVRSVQRKISEGAKALKNKLEHKAAHGDTGHIEIGERKGNIRRRKSEVRGINIKQIGKPTHKRQDLYTRRKRKGAKRRMNCGGSARGLKPGNNSRKSVRKAV